MPNNAKPIVNDFAEKLCADLCSWHRETKILPAGRFTKHRINARRVLEKAGRGTVNSAWINNLECSLYYASSCSLDERFSSSLREAAANLRRNDKAGDYPADLWAFLPLVVLSRPNRTVHLERIRYGLALFEKIGRMTELEETRLRREIGFYSDSDPDLHKTLMERLEAKPVEEDEEQGDWIGSEKCPHCGSHKTKFTHDLLMRSADEPLTNFYLCVSCKQSFNDMNK
jgi:DNA-directed RNA polymerase subunit M/transcription elongation factor TFIIS